ncbi:MAG: glycosyltransferase [Bacilli bacterium]|nr:glycosyltransferase [Bacilli bacterium]
MKILMATPYYDPNIVGGAEISTQLIAEGLAERGHEVDVITVGIEDSIKIMNGVKIYTISLGIISVIWKKVLSNKKINIIEKIVNLFFNLYPLKKYTHKYLKFMKREKYDLVLVNSNIDSLGRASFWKAAKLSGASLVLVLRDPLLLYKQFLKIRFDNIYRTIIKKQLIYIDCIVAPSQYMLDLYSSLGLFHINSHVIYNAIDIDMQKASYNMKNNIILYAGSIRTEKGIKTLVNAFQMLKDKEYTLKLVGRGELAEKCKDFQGVFVDEWMERKSLYNLMDLSKIVILPSEYPEAFGRILIEAIANGTLAIGSKIGGIPEVFEGDEKYLYTTGDSKALKNKIERILNLEPYEYELEVQELQKKFKKFSKENYITQWEYLFKKNISKTY